MKVKPRDFITKWEECGRCKGKGHIAYPDGAKLRALREAQGIGLRELAEWMEISAAFPSDMELGRRRISMDRLNGYLLALAAGSGK